MKLRWAIKGHLDLLFCFKLLLAIFYFFPIKHDSLATDYIMKRRTALLHSSTLCEWYQRHLQELSLSNFRIPNAIRVGICITMMVACIPGKVLYLQVSAQMALMSSTLLINLSAPSALHVCPILPIHVLI